MINVYAKNSTYIKVIADEEGVEQELSDFFSFDSEGAKFSKAFRKGHWDGKVRLYTKGACTLYKGLINYVQAFADQRGYPITIHDGLNEYDDIDEDKYKKFINSFALTPRYFQEEVFRKVLTDKRGLFISPTGSGKSFTIYMIMKWFRTKKKLIVVPTTSLVKQMETDFIDYGHTRKIHKIAAGVSKESNCDITVSTWQSIYKQPKEWFKQFDLIIGDEAHLFSAQSLKSILSAMEGCEYKIGLTGTIHETRAHRLVLEGLFGALKRVATTKQLMDEKILADLKIQAILLEYEPHIKDRMLNAKYKDEIDFLIGCKERNNFIKNLTLASKGTTLVLYNYVEAHGQILYDLISASTDRKVHFIHGLIEAEDREIIRKQMEESDDDIAIASSGTYSAGINIKSLKYLISTSPSKSRIRVLQSLGRLVRRVDDDPHVTLYDIGDNLHIKLHKPNHTLRHFAKRIQMFRAENFNFKIHKVRIKIDG